MARSRRASSSVVDITSNNNGAGVQASPSPLPQPTSYSTVGRFKKASKLATTFLKHLKSPSNSDGEDSEDDGHSDSDLDFGCSGLREAFNEQHLDDDTHELHISLQKILLQSIMDEQKSMHNGGNSQTIHKQLELNIPTRSASIADSIISSSSSTRVSSSSSTSHSTATTTSTTSECTLSTPTSQSQSTRSSFSSPHLHLASTSLSPTKQTFFHTHSPETTGSSPRASMSTSNASHPQSSHSQNAARRGSTAITAIPVQPALLEEEEEEEEEEESEEAGVLRRKLEEEAAIEALEAYFAFRKASDSVSSVTSTTSSSSAYSLHKPSTPSSSSSSSAVAVAAAHSAKQNTSEKSTLQEESKPNGGGRKHSSSISRSERSNSIPYSSPYFEMYADEPLFNFFPSAIQQQQQQDQIPQSSSGSKAPNGLTLAGAGNHRQIASRTGKGSDLASPLDPFMKISPRTHLNPQPTQMPPSPSTSTSTSASAPLLRTRRSEASLKTSQNTSSSSSNGLTHQPTRRRPSLANGLMPIQIRPRGYTYSTSPSGGRSNSEPSSSSSGQCSSVPSLSPTLEITQVAALPTPAPTSPASPLSPSSTYSLSPSIYAVSIPSVPSTPSHQSCITPTAAHEDDYNSQTTVKCERVTPTSSSFLDLSNSPENERFRDAREDGKKSSGVNGMRRKGSSAMLGPRPMPMVHYQVIPSPPRSSSLVNAQNGMQEAQAQALALSTALQLKENTTTITTAPRVNFDPSLDYHQQLEAYKFPDRFSSGRRANNSTNNSTNSSTSNSALSTPALTPSASSTSLAQLSSVEEVEDDERLHAMAALPVKVHTPLGSATASRRGSLVSSPSQAQLRSRAGSMVAGSVVSPGAVSFAPPAAAAAPTSPADCSVAQKGGIMLNRNPSYGYI